MFGKVNNYANLANISEKMIFQIYLLGWGYFPLFVQFLWNVLRVYISMYNRNVVTKRISWL